MHVDLTKGEVNTHLKNLAIPASIGFFFHTMYNITDTYFAGLISTQSLSALSVTFAIFFMIVAVGAGMSEAVTSIVGNLLGESKRAHARNSAINAILLAAILGVLITIIGLSLSPKLLMFIGVNGGYLVESLAYIDTVMYGAIFFVLSFFINSILNALGDTVSFRNVLVVGFFINIVLDAWFTLGGFGLEPMGVFGIALATVIIEMLGMFYLFYRLSKTPLLRRMRIFRLDLSIYKNIITHGTAPSLNLVLMAIGVYLVTYFIAPFGKEAVAAYGVGMRIEQIVLLPIIGINIAVLAIVSQNNGAKKYHRIRDSISSAIKISAVISVIGVISVLYGAEFMMGLFSNDSLVVEMGSLYLRISILILFAYAIIFIHIALLQGIKQTKFIFYISILRQLLIPMVIFGIFAFYKLDLEAYWWGIFFINLSAAIFSRMYSFSKLRVLSST